MKKPFFIDDEQVFFFLKLIINNSPTNNNIIYYLSRIHRSIDRTLVSHKAKTPHRFS